MNLSKALFITASAIQFLNNYIRKSLYRLNKMDTCGADCSLTLHFQNWTWNCDLMDRAAPHRILYKWLWYIVLLILFRGYFKWKCYVYHHTSFYRIWRIFHRIVYSVNMRDTWGVGRSLTLHISKLVVKLWFDGVGGAPQNPTLKRLSLEIT